MATDIVQSLFGVTPQGYQQQQADMASQQAMQYARLDPFQQANYAIGRGAYGLAGALGGALGGQDPELQLISTRNSIAKQIDYSDLNSISQGVRMLGEAGDTVGAMQLADVYRKAQESGALVGQREAAGKASLAQAGREKVQASPKEVQLAREVALLSGPEGSIEYNTAYATSLQEQMAKPESKKPTTNELTNAENIALQAGPVGSPAYNKAFMDEYKRLTAPKEDKGPAFGTDREAVAAEIYGTTFGGLTQAQKAVVNKRVEEEGGRKAAAGAAKLTNVLPGTKELVDIPAFRSKVQGTIEPQLKTINATDQALQAIEDSLATGNFASYRAAQVQFARAISGAGDLSQRELKAAGADPSLLGGTADYLSSLFTSTPTTDTQNKIRTTLEAIRKVAAKKSSNEVEQQRKMALRSPGYNPEAVTEALTFPELSPRVVAPVPGAIGSDLAAQAAAELARRKAAKAK